MAIIDVGPGVSVQEEELVFTFTTASGPGGQNVNKVSTRAVLRVAVAALMGLHPSAAARLKVLASHKLTDSGELLISCQETRSQQRNRDAVLEELRSMIVAAQHVPKPRRKTKPSRASQMRRIEGKKRRGEIKSGRRAVE
jgi:ribosome-associated protein